MSQQALQGVVSTLLISPTPCKELFLPCLIFPKKIRSPTLMSRIPGNRISAGTCHVKLTWCAHNDVWHPHADDKESERACLGAVLLCYVSLMCAVFDCVINKDPSRLFDDFCSQSHTLRLLKLSNQVISLHYWRHEQEGPWRTKTFQMMRMNPDVKENEQWLWTKKRYTITTYHIYKRETVIRIQYHCHHIM